jgi:hypothetical protein
VICWGKTKSGKQRFFCSACNKTITRRRKDIKNLNYYPWFEKWLSGVTVNFISQISKKDPNTIRSIINHFLANKTLIRPVANPNCHMVIDATYFSRNCCLIVYWDVDKKIVQKWRYSFNRERFDEILADLEEMKQSGVVLASVTSDGAHGIRQAVATLYPNIPHQRCLVHLQRLGLAFLTQNPKTVAGKELRYLVTQTNKITTLEERDYWRRDFYHWCNENYSFLKQRSFYSDRKHWWYTHRYLRRVKRTIINALPNMWYYLNNENIPKDTNGLEGRWNGLKDHYQRHRGLSRHKRENYFSWYLKTVVNFKKPTLI